MKKDRTMYVLFGIFLIIGLGLLIGGGNYGVHYASFRANAEEITGKIERIEEYYDSDGELRHSAYVSYTYDGVDYSGVSINSYNSSMYEGKEITLLFDPEKPYYIQEKSSGVILIASLMGMGIVFALVGGIPLVMTIRKDRQNKKLLANGHVLHAVVESIDYNANVTVNGAHPFVIFCSYHDEYKDRTYRFKSESIWTDPSIVFQPGSPIEVYVQPDDYSKYYVNAEKVLTERVVDFT